MPEGYGVDENKRRADFLELTAVPSKRPKSNEILDSISNFVTSFKNKLMPGPKGAPESFAAGIPEAVSEAYTSAAAPKMATMEAGLEGARGLGEKTLQALGTGATAQAETQASLVSEKYTATPPGITPAGLPGNQPTVNFPKVPTPSTPATPEAVAPAPKAGETNLPPFDVKLPPGSTDADAQEAAKRIIATGGINVTPETRMEQRIADIGATRVPGTEMGWKAEKTKEGMGGTISDERGKVLATVPKVRAGIGDESAWNAQATQAIAKIDDLIDSVRGRTARNLGEQKAKSVELAHLIQTRAGIIQAGLGAEAHKETAKATREMSFDYQKASIAERERHNRILEADMALKMQQQKDTAEGNYAQRLLNSMMVHETNMLTGEKNPNLAMTAFDIWRSGSPVPSMMKDITTNIEKRFNDYVADFEKANKRKITDAEMPIAYRKFREKLSLNYNPSERR